MNATLRQVSHHLFEQYDLHQVQLEELDYLIEEYPYFSAFHILKAKKMISEQNHSSDMALQRAAIFYYNPHWFNYQIHHDEPFIPHEEHLAEIMTTPDSEIIPKIDTTELLPDSEIEIEAQEVSFDDKRTSSSEAYAEVLSKINMSNETEGETEPGLIFDPLHTIDYFASQGIKIPTEIIEQDQLSIKLRSFTEWLRTMKRLHPEKFQQAIVTGNEKEQVLKDDSDTENEVITEAMAEVYALQGLKEKAIGVYKKLSLLEPEKRDYFAYRINDLK